MANQYFCQNARRRQAVRDHGTLNGIDYLEVLDTDAPPGSPRQQTLLVRCLKDAPDGLTPHQVRLLGGVRIAPVVVAWVSRARDADLDALLADGRIIAAEHTFFSGLPEREALLLVRTEAAGDFSTYRLCLYPSSEEARAANFDPVLAEVDFSFKVECPSDFDCAPVDTCPPAPQTVPPLDYLAKDYASFRQLMLDRLSVVMPAWTERSPADLGIAVVETLAYAADHLSYFQDAVATEAYLGTARRRPSVRRHARLLDYPMHDGCNARVWVYFEVDATVTLPAATPLLTRTADPRTVIPTLDFEAVRSLHQPTVFELMHDVTLRRAHNEMTVYTWGDEDCCLPGGATRATLRGHFPNLRPGDLLLFEEIRSPETGVREDADPAHRHVVRLTAATLSEDPLGGRFLAVPTDDPVNVTEVAWDAADAFPFALCVNKVINGRLNRVAVARGNVALADTGRTLAAEDLPTATGDRFFRPALAEPGLTHAQPYAPNVPAAEALTQDPRRSLPAITLLDGEGVTWQPRRDLLASDRFDTDFVAELETNGQARLRFGDGVYGRTPPSGLTLTATYRIGNGTTGNVGAGALAHVVTDQVGLVGVRNPLPATGGTDPESLDEVRLYAPQAFRTQERAVTAADYAAVAERHPDVQKAVATRRWTGSWYTLFITVDRRGGRTVDAAFETELRAWIERFRLAGHDVEIDAPRFVPLDLAFTVCVQPGYFQSDVRQALFDVFSNHTLPNGQQGFFHPDRFTFGQPVYLSQVVTAAMQVPGVRYVTLDANAPHRFQRWGQAPNDEVAQGRIALGRLEIARLDNDPNAQENGRLELFMEGGTG